MVSHRWKFIGKTENATIFVDYRLNMTKIKAKQGTYYHDGIYPFHNPVAKRRFRR